MKDYVYLVRGSINQSEAIVCESFKFPILSIENRIITYRTLDNLTGEKKLRCFDCIDESWFTASIWTFKGRKLKKYKKAIIFELEAHLMLLRTRTGNP